MLRVHHIVTGWECFMMLLLLLLVEHARGQDPPPATPMQYFNFRRTDLHGLKELYANWNKSTPDLGKNLAGWRVIPQDLSSQEACPCFTESWQGVLCLRELQPTLPGYFYEAYNVSVVGLTLTDASLTGSLPPAIGNLTSLVSLILTGNKDLKGALPSALKSLYSNLNMLDLHGNGFNGSIPTTSLENLGQLQELDLSQNQFNGILEVDFRKMKWLRTLNLSRNSFSGTVIQDYLQNLTQLITLDFSSNRFSGPLFSLKTSPSLNSLNLSYNSFSGEVRPSDILFNTNSSLDSLKEVDLSNNALTGRLPDFRAWANLTLLDLSNNQFQRAPFPIWTSSLKKNLQVLRLKRNNLTGQFPNGFLHSFMKLKILELDNNHINGPFNIEDIIGFPMLELFSLSNNNITDVSYNGSSFKTIEKFGINLRGNPYCAQTSPQNYLKLCVCEQKCFDPETTLDHGNRNSIAVIATSVAASLLAIVILIISLVFWKTRREKLKLQLQVQQHFAENDIKPTIFTFNQLRVATQDFSERTKIGEGSFGAVYKGSLHTNAKPVAVKQLFLRNAQSIAEFLNEVVMVTAIKHRNLVNLKGCCVREDQRLLVYEYLDNYDLAHHLFDQKARQVHLNWPHRFHICLGIARGLHYLHALAQPRIIHRDIKASNVLLDHDFHPKIADFGLALFFPDEQSRIITSDIAGTRGYWAPEYATVGQLSEKADIYSFGVLLLEVVSGRKSLDYDMPEHKAYLCQWARELYNQSDVMELVDPVLSLSKVEEAEVRRIINIALLCVQVEPELRPTMAAIVATLEGSLNLDAEGMQHVCHATEPLTLAHFHLGNEPDNFPLFSSQTQGSSSTTSCSSLGSRASVGSSKCDGTLGSSIVTLGAR